MTIPHSFILNENPSTPLGFLRLLKVFLKQEVEMHLIKEAEYFGGEQYSSSLRYPL
jgi:hypothetical protein